MRALLAQEDQRMPRAMITIVARRGSAPRDVGTKMLVYPDGRCVGTIGGGCVESDVVRSARMLLDEKDPSTQILDVDMTDDDAEDAGMVCGGVIRVLVEVIEPARGIQS
jgi:xanthine dehydrogenase accessory factor